MNQTFASIEYKRYLPNSHGNALTVRLRDRIHYIRMKYNTEKRDNALANCHANVLILQVCILDILSFPNTRNLLLLLEERKEIMQY